MPGFDHSVVQSRSRPTHRLADPATSASGPERLGGEFAALVSVEYDPTDLMFAAANRDRHGQCPVGQLGVVVLTDREPDDAP